VGRSVKGSFDAAVASIPALGVERSGALARLLPCRRSRRLVLRVFLAEAPHASDRFQALLLADEAAIHAAAMAAAYCAHHG